MKKQANRGRPIVNVGGLDTLPKGQPIKMYQFMSALCNTSPVTLEEMTGIERGKWYGWVSNFRQGKMSLDKQIELAKHLGADTSSIDVILN